MPVYKHIFFDLDHTLWDFDKNSAEALCDLYEQFGLAGRYSFTTDEFCKAFREVNFHLWRMHQLGNYGQAQLRAERFPLIFGKLGLKDTELDAGEMSLLAEAYLQLCPTKPHVFPHTHEVLGYLQDRYQLHILTNGFSDVQWIKLRSAGLSAYFKEIVTSDDAGFRKPQADIFHYSLRRISAECSECLMIGDNLETDMDGALGVGMDCIFFNPAKIQHQSRITYEISCLSQLKGIL
ncbi:MAG: YjjG family noncanonical pyrimidine nucleotidase [Cyclobacteriaceae bacterium]